MTTEQAGAADAAPRTIRVRADYRPTLDDMATLESMGEKDEQGRPAFKWRDVQALFRRALVGGGGDLPVDDAATWQAVGDALKAYFERRSNPNA